MTKSTTRGVGRLVTICLAVSISVSPASGAIIDTSGPGTDWPIGTLIELQPHTVFSIKLKHTKAVCKIDYYFPSSADCDEIRYTVHTERLSTAFRSFLPQARVEIEGIDGAEWTGERYLPPSLTEKVKISGAAIAGEWTYVPYKFQRQGQSLKMESLTSPTWHASLHMTTGGSTVWGNAETLLEHYNTAINHAGFYIDRWIKGKKIDYQQLEVEKITTDRGPILTKHMLSLRTFPSARLSNTTDAFKIGEFVADSTPERWPVQYSVNAQAPLTFLTDGGTGGGGLHPITAGTPLVARGGLEKIYAMAASDEIKQLNGQTISINVSISLL
ncbi:hypothetical protein QSO38_002244 [Escherichia coli]|nr:hypothetical protein [Escherichia coli]